MWHCLWVVHTLIIQWYYHGLGREAHLRSVCTDSHCTHVQSLFPRWSAGIVYGYGARDVTPARYQTAVKSERERERGGLRCSNCGKLGSLSAVAVEVQRVDCGAVEPSQLLLLAQLELRETSAAVRPREEPRRIQPALTGREKLQHDSYLTFSSLSELEQAPSEFSSFRFSAKLLTCSQIQALQG